MWCGLWFEGSAAASDPLAQADWAAARRAEGFEVRIIEGEALVRLLRWDSIFDKTLNEQVEAVFQHIQETDLLLRNQPPFVPTGPAPVAPRP